MPDLHEGMERTDTFTVEDRLLTDVGGTIGAAVLSTPGMIAMMERNSSILAFENLPDGRATVGFEVCIKHVAAAGEGARCTVSAQLTEVREGDRTIGVGTHQRRVVPVPPRG